MMRGAALLLAVLAAPVFAEAPDTSVRPQSRPAAATQMAAAVAAIVKDTSAEEIANFRPQARPISEVATAAPVPDASMAARGGMMVSASALAVATSLRPALRTNAILAGAEQERVARVRGQVCGDPDIQGEAIADIHGSGSCGVDDPVRIRSILGVGFSEQPTIDCNTAVALKNWIQRGAIPAIGSEGGGLKRLEIMGHYTCRNQVGSGRAKLSEHAFGRAIDIGGFRLNDGSIISVLQDWGSRSDGAQLRTMHDAACGIFGTVLGPEANAAHRNHFHFDTARYRTGSYCR